MVPKASLASRSDRSWSERGEHHSYFSVETIPGSNNYFEDGGPMPSVTVGSIPFCRSEEIKCWTRSSREVELSVDCSSVLDCKNSSSSESCWWVLLAVLLVDVRGGVVVVELAGRLPMGTEEDDNTSLFGSGGCAAT